MKKIDRLVLQSFIGPFIATFFIALFVLVMQFLWKYVDDMVGKGLSLPLIAELIFYSCATLVPLALPLAVLLSSIMTLGNLGEHYELVALKSSGISLLRIIVSLVVAVIFLAGVAFWFSNYVLPIANLKQGVLLYDIRKKQPAFAITEGVFYNGIEGYSIKVGNKLDDGITLEDVIIYDHTKGRGNNNVTIAKKAIILPSKNGKYMTFQLFNGEQYEEQQARPKPRIGDSFEHMRTKFKQFNKVFDMSGFDMKNTNEELFKNNYRMLNIRQLQYSVDSINIEIEKRSDILDKHIKKYVGIEQDTIVRDSAILKKIITDIKLDDKVSIDSIANDSVLLNNSKRVTKKVEVANDEKSNTDKSAEVVDSLKIDTISLTQKEKDDMDTVVNNEILDTIAKVPTPVQIDSTLLSFIPAQYKSKISKRALDNAKNSKGYVNVARRDVEIKERTKNKYHMEWHRKFVLSIGCIVLFFVGAPLGAITRRGGLGLPMILSIIFFVIYHLLSTFGKKLSEEFILSPFTGMWLSTIVLAPLGVFLTYKALNDSNLINIDAYIDWFRKRFEQFGLIKKDVV